MGTEGTAYGVVEYADDDYKVSGVGGLFSTVMFTSTNVGQSVTANDGAQVKDLTFSNCNVALTYIDTNGEAKTGEAPNDLTGAGLLAGATANYDDGTCGIYRNVQMKNCTVSGAKSVGGLLGSSGRARRTTSEDRTYMVEFGDGWGPRISMTAHTLALTSRARRMSVAMWVRSPRRAVCGQPQAQG